MSDQFVDTPFNRDCPHHGLTFTRATILCPYCFAESKAHASERMAHTVRWFIICLVLGVLLWRSFR